VIKEVVICPGHSLRVGQYWNVAGGEQIEEQAVDIRWENMMRGLNEDVPTVVYGEHKTCSQFAN
jgi:hypothetical protein